MKVREIINILHDINSVQNSLEEAKKNAKSDDCVTIDADLVYLINDYLDSLREMYEKMEIKQ